MTYTQLNDAIAAYGAALESLPTLPADDAPAKVMRVLLSRNCVADALSEQPLTDPANLNTLTEIDQKLKDCADTVLSILGRETLANWRETMQPPSGYWWWSLIEHTTPKPNPLWTIFSVLFLAAAAALTAEIARRFLSSGGSDFAAISIPLLQAVLTVLSGSTLTQTGQEWIERFLLRHNIARKHHPMLKTAIPLFVLLVSVGVYLSLPSFGRSYSRRYLNQQAYDLQQIGKLDEAIKNYERAINLDPDFAPAHYNLGNAYETSGDYDKAILEYQSSLRLDMKSTFAPYAYNNLARLFLLRRNDPSTALNLLNIALEQNPTDPFNRYSLYKNRAWAHFTLKCFSLAATDLCEALKLREDGAAAYCLLAQVLEAQGSPAAAEPWGVCTAYKNGSAEAWAQCEAYKAGQEREIEASWLSLAQEHLRKEAAK